MGVVPGSPRGPEGRSTGREVPTDWQKLIPLTGLPGSLVAGPTSTDGCRGWALDSFC